MCKFKVGDKVKTRNGLDVEIVHIDDRLGLPVVGIRTLSEGNFTIDTWSKDGRFHYNMEESQLDIIPPSRNVTLYPALVRTEDGYYFTPSGLFRGLDDIELAVWNSCGFEFIRLLTEYPIEVEL
jgi:hypothetical protein